MVQRKDTAFVTVCHPVCCGLDIHKDLIVACLLGDKEDGTEYWELREFGAFRDDLIRLRDWLQEVRVSDRSHGKHRHLLATGV